MIMCWDRIIHQIEVDHHWVGREYKGGSPHALGKVESGVGEHLSVMGRGPLGSKARLSLCSSRWGDTRGPCVFVGIDWDRPISEAHMIMAMQRRPGRDRLGQGIGL